MKHADYVHKLNTYALDQAGSSASTAGVKELPTSQSLYDNLENLFYIEHEVKHLFQLQPNFVRYTEADETLRKNNPKFTLYSGATLQNPQHIFPPLLIW